MGLFRKRLYAPAALAILAVAIATAAAAGCGGSGTSRPMVTVEIAPKTVTDLRVGGTQRFEATVSGSENGAVEWSAMQPAAEPWLSERGPNTVAFAPLEPGTFHIVATSLADNRMSDAATVTVAP